MDPAIVRLLQLQGGVLSRAQAREAGLLDHDIRRLLRRRDLAPIHPGVYVDHTGSPTWHQRAWAAVLFCEPAALCRESARRAAEGPGRRGNADHGPIHVAVDRNRSVRPPAGVVVHRVRALADQVQWNTSPPRQRIEHAVIDQAASAPDLLDAVGYLSDAVGARLTTGDRLAATLRQRVRVPRRAFLDSVITDVSGGTCSTLERGYLTQVERAHGLPTARRQLRESVRGPLYRDAAYEGYHLIVELDGRFFHSSARDRDRDLDRDLDAFLERRVTVRLGWGQVFVRPCLTAARIGGLLQQRGWTGRLERCARCPSAAA